MHAGFVPGTRLTFLDQINDRRTDGQSNVQSIIGANFPLLVEYHRVVVSRVYPSASYTLSGNYCPILPWSLGIQGSNIPRIQIQGVSCTYIVHLYSLLQAQIHCSAASVTILQVKKLQSMHYFIYCVTSIKAVVLDKT